MAAQPVRNIETPIFSQPIERTEVVSEVQIPSQARQAYQILRFGFTVAPLIAGLDKFFYYLVDWNQYLSPYFPSVLGTDPRTFMLGVGAIEVLVGIGVAFKPRIFSYILSAWLVGIVINLLMTGTYFDIALRDIGLALGALALGRLSEVFNRERQRSYS